MTGPSVDIMIPTLNEGSHIAAAIASAATLGPVFVLDSFSTDGTQHAARAAGAVVVEHKFVDYASQKNWGLDNLPFTGDWVFILDADERITPTLQREIFETLSRPDAATGYYVNRLMLFMGSKIRHGGYYPSWNLRLFRRGKARYEQRTVHEHMICNGPTDYLKEEMLHVRSESMHQFIAKHVKYANLETTEWVKLKFGGSREAHASNLFKNALRYRQYVRRVLWRQMPLRPMWRFLYMYIWKRGFLDGAAGWRLAWLLTSYEYIITLLYQEKVLAEQRRRSVRRTVADQDGTMISVTEETNMPARPASPVTGPLRILHLTGASDAGGLSRYIFDLSMAMHAQGHQVTVAGERGAWHWLFDSAPFPWIEVPLKGGPFALHKAIDRLEAYLDEHPVDVLHVHYRRCALVARRIQQTHPVPMLYTLHLSNFSLGWFRRRLTDFGDHTHVASDEARKWLIHSAGVPQEQISMVPHGIDPLRFPQADDAARAAARAELGLSPTDVVAAYVGRMDVPKNETWMIDLAAASRDRLPNLKVIMVGEGPHENMLRRRVRRQNLGDRVLLLGHRDPLHIYYAADAFLLPSAREGFSLVCAEAMSTGIPVLRTNTAGTGELIVENATGKSVPIDHKAFIAGAMDFLSDSVGLKRMGRLAAHHVKEHFTFDRQLHDTIDLYRSLIRLTSPAPLNPPPPL